MVLFVPNLSFSPNTKFVGVSLMLALHQYKSINVHHSKSGTFIPINKSTSISAIKNSVYIWEWLGCFTVVNGTTVNTLPKDPKKCLWI